MNSNARLDVGAFNSNAGNKNTYSCHLGTETALIHLFFSCWSACVGGMTSGMPSGKLLIHCTVRCWGHLLREILHKHQHVFMSNTNVRSKYYVLVRWQHLGRFHACGPAEQTQKKPMSASTTLQEHDRVLRKKTNACQRMRPGCKRTWTVCSGSRTQTGPPANSARVDASHSTRWRHA